MANARARARRSRRAVDRSERVRPTPETLAKLKPWPLQVLLQVGPDDGGIDVDQFEAAVEIVDGFHAITRELGFKPLLFDRVSRGVADMPARDVRLATIFLAWGVALLNRHRCQPAVIVEWIEDSRGSIDLHLLRRALSLWTSTRGEYDRMIAATKKRRGEAPPFRVV